MGVLPTESAAARDGDLTPKVYARLSLVFGVVAEIIVLQG